MGRFLRVEDPLQFGSAGAFIRLPYSIRRQQQWTIHVLVRKANQRERSWSRRRANRVILSLSPLLRNVTPNMFSGYLTHPRPEMRFGISCTV